MHCLPRPSGHLEEVWMFLVDTSGYKSIGIVDASRVTKSIVNYKEIMGHNDGLQINLVTNRG